MFPMHCLWSDSSSTVDRRHNIRTFSKNSGFGSQSPLTLSSGANKCIPEPNSGGMSVNVSWALVSPTDSIPKSVPQPSFFALLCFERVLSFFFRLLARAIGWLPGMRIDTRSFPSLYGRMLCWCRTVHGRLGDVFYVKVPVPPRVNRTRYLSSPPNHS